MPGLSFHEDRQVSDKHVHHFARVFWKDISDTSFLGIKSTSSSL